MHGSQRACTVGGRLSAGGGGRRRGRRRRRRDVDTNARVIPDAELIVDEVANRAAVEAQAASVRIGVEIVPIVGRDIPRQPGAKEEPVLQLPRQAERGRRQALQVGRRRRDAAVGGDDRRGHGHRVVGRHFTGDFRGDANRAVRGESGAESPAQAVGLRDFRGLAADDGAAVAGHFELLRDVLAEHDVEERVELARADAGVFLPRRDLDGAANRERDRLLVLFREEIDLEANERVADVVAGPSLIDERIRGDHAADVGVRCEDRAQVPIDARIEFEGSEELDAAHHAGGKRCGEVGDVAEALDVVRALSITARGPGAARQHFGGRRVPQSGIAGRRGRRGSRGVGRGLRGGRAGEYQAQQTRQAHQCHQTRDHKCHGTRRFRHQAETPAVQQNSTLQRYSNWTFNSTAELYSKSINELASFSFPARNLCRRGAD